MPELFKIRKPIARQWQLGLGLAAWALVLVVWVALTRSRFLPPLVVPNPMSVVAAFGRLWTENDLLANVFQSWWRIAQAFLWSAVVAIPLGLLMGSFPWVYHFVVPVAAPMRFMPITAFLPACIGMFGLDEAM